MPSSPSLQNTSTSSVEPENGILTAASSSLPFSSSPLPPYDDIPVVLSSSITTQNDIFTAMPSSPSLHNTSTSTVAPENGILTAASSSLPFSFVPLHNDNLLALSSSMPQKINTITIPSTSSQLQDDNYSSFNEAFWKVRKWTNDTIFKCMVWKDIRTTAGSGVLPVDKFLDYLQFVFPQNTEMSRQSCALQAAASAKGGTKDEKLRVFVAHLCPPVKLHESTEVATFTKGDLIPQFALDRKGKKYVYKCICCPLVENKNKRSVGTVFEGISQLHQHAVSVHHKATVRILRGEQIMKKKVTSSSAIMDNFLGKKNTIAKCHNIIDQTIVEAFSNDQMIHRMSVENVFNLKTEYHCKIHDDCKYFLNWKIMHPVMYKELLSIQVSQAVYLPITKTVSINGKQVAVQGVIQSAYPPCTGKATSTGSHPYMCDPCHQQLVYLKNLLGKRKKSKLNDDSRIFSPGMRTGYLKKNELTEKHVFKDQLHTQLKKAYRDDTKMVGTSDTWLQKLEESCTNNDEVKFVKDCLELIEDGGSEKFPVQMAVLQNLVGKLRSGRNHHYCDLIKKVAKMEKNWMGATNYAVLKVRTMLCTSLIEL